MKKSALLTACAVLAAASLALYGCDNITGTGSNGTENGGSSGGNNGSGGDNNGGSGGGTDNPGNGGTDNPGNGGDNNGGGNGGNNGGSGGDNGGNNGGSGGTEGPAVFDENMTGKGDPAAHFKATLLQTVKNDDGTTAYYYVLNKDSTLTIPEDKVTSAPLNMASGFETKYLDSSDIVYYEGAYSNPDGLFYAIPCGINGSGNFDAQLWIQIFVPVEGGTKKEMRWLFSGPSTASGYIDSSANIKAEYGTFTRKDNVPIMSLKYANPEVSLIRYCYPNMDKDLENTLFAGFMQGYDFSFDAVWSPGAGKRPDSYTNVHAKMIPVVVTTVNADGTWGKSDLQRIFPPFF